MLNNQTDLIRNSDCKNNHCHYRRYHSPAPAYTVKQFTLQLTSKRTSGYSNKFIPESKLKKSLVLY